MLFPAEALRQLGIRDTGGHAANKDGEVSLRSFSPRHRLHNEGGERHDLAHGESRAASRFRPWTLR